MEVEIGAKYTRRGGPYGGDIFTCVSITTRNDGQRIARLSGHRNYSVNTGIFYRWFFTTPVVRKLNWK